MGKQTRFYKHLIRRYRSGEASEKEVTLFMELLRQDKHRAEIEHLMDEELGIQTEPIERKSSYPFLRYAAAIVLLALAASTISYFSRTTTTREVRAMEATAPASHKATLRLANGREVLLDSSSGQLFLDTDLVKNENGEVLHQEQKPEAYYEISVPKGGTYQLSLSDGSKVWLNSESSLRFPQQFAAESRNIELKGEAFFEVKKQTDAKGNRIPFIVQTPKQYVEVLGTQFNVTAYANENREMAALVEGSVRVKDKSRTVEKLLRPGFRSILEADGSILVGKADLEEICGWKSGEFIFNETAIKDIVKQLARWYDVDIVYKGESDFALNGYMQRNITLGEALSTLKNTGELDYSFHQGRVIIKQIKRPM